MVAVLVQLFVFLGLATGRLCLRLLPPRALPLPILRATLDRTETPDLGPSIAGLSIVVCFKRMLVFVAGRRAYH